MWLYSFHVTTVEYQLLHTLYLSLDMGQAISPTWSKCGSKCLDNLMIFLIPASLIWGKSPFQAISMKHCLQMKGALKLTVISAASILKLQIRQRSFIILHKCTLPYLNLDKSGNCQDKQESVGCFLLYPWKITVSARTTCSTRMKITTFSKLQEFGIITAELNSGLQVLHTLVRLPTNWEELTTICKIPSLGYK